MYRAASTETPWLPSSLMTLLTLTPGEPLQIHELTCPTNRCMLLCKVKVLTCPHVCRSCIEEGHQDYPASGDSASCASVLASERAAGHTSAHEDSTEQSMQCQVRLLQNWLLLT